MAQPVVFRAHQSLVTGGFQDFVLGTSNPVHPFAKVFGNMELVVHDLLIGI